MAWPQQPCVGPSLAVQPAQPPAAVDAADVHLENYIPLRYPDLRDRLLADHAHIFAGQPQLAADFVTLAQRISLLNQIKLSAGFRGLQERYSYLDPDVDVLESLSGSTLGRQERRALSAEFDAGFTQLLTKGGFEAITQEQLEAAMETTGVVNGLQVSVPPLGSIEYQVLYRSWRTMFLEKALAVPVYQRLAIMFRAVDQAADWDGAGPAGKGNDDEPGERLSWWKRLALGGCLRTKVVRQAHSASVDPRWTYLKLFKDIDVCDVDMLLPGSVARFSKLDHAMIWGPILFGLGSAIFKACRGTLDFSSSQQILTSLLLVLLPLTWGVRAYLAVKDKQRLYEARMNRLFLLHNLNNNAGVISCCLEEAREQEDNEALLAFFFAWLGREPEPPALDQQQLDAAVESYINTLLIPGETGQKLALPGKAKQRKGGGKQATAGAGSEARPAAAASALPIIDFEVADAVAKLVELGLLQAIYDVATGRRLFKAVSLQQALQLTHISRLQQPQLTSSSSTSSSVNAFAWTPAAGATAAATVAGSWAQSGNAPLAAPQQQQPAVIHAAAAAAAAAAAVAAGPFGQQGFSAAQQPSGYGAVAAGAVLQQPGPQPPWQPAAPIGWVPASATAVATGGVGAGNISTARLLPPVVGSRGNSNRVAPADELLQQQMVPPLPMCRSAAT